MHWSTDLRVVKSVQIKLLQKMSEHNLSSAEELAEFAGIGLSTAKNYMNGTPIVMGGIMLGKKTTARLADAFKVDKDYFRKI